MYVKEKKITLAGSRRVKGISSLPIPSLHQALPLVLVLITPVKVVWAEAVSWASLALAAQKLSQNRCIVFCHRSRVFSNQNFT